MDLFFIYTKAKFSWNKDFHGKGETVNILEENLRGGTYTWSIEGLLNKMQIILFTKELSTD